MLIEICFVDSSDVYKYTYIGKEVIANGIVEGLTGQTVANQWQLGWNKNSTGWWYCTDAINKYYYKNQWKLIGNKWYSFDSNGYARQSLWIQDQGEWYYLKENCIMAKQEWLWTNGECYCFAGNGKLYIDTITPDGYKVDYSGAWIK